MHPADAISAAGSRQIGSVIEELGLLQLEAKRIAAVEGGSETTSSRLDRLEMGAVAAVEAAEQFLGSGRSVNSGDESAESLTGSSSPVPEENSVENRECTTADSIWTEKCPTRRTESPSPYYKYGHGIAAHDDPFRSHFRGALAAQPCELTADRDQAGSFLPDDDFGAGGADIGPDIDIPRHVEPVDSETFETANVEAPHGPLSCDPVEFGRAKNGRTIEVGPDVGIGMNRPECDEVSGLRRGWSEGRKLAGRISARSAATDMAARTCAANPAYPSDVRCAGLDDGRMSAISG